MKLAGTLPDKEDGGKPATEGARGSENCADVKKSMPPGQSVENAPNNPKDGDTNKPVPDSGLMQTEVGRMPEVERAVRTVSEENEKAAAADLTTEAGIAASIASLEKLSASLAILTTASAGRAPQPIKAAAGQPQTPVALQTNNQATDQPKIAAEAESNSVVADYIKFGSDRAELVNQYLQGFWTMTNELQKLADDGALASMAQGGMPDGSAPGGAPPVAPPAAAPPSPGGDMGAGGDMGGGASGPPNVDELASALAEMGVSPDELMQVAQKMKGDIGGGSSPEVSPTDKEAAVKELETVIKEAGEAKKLMRTGRFSLKPAADGSPERKGRDAARNYISELLGYASRA